MFYFVFFWVKSILSIKNYQYLPLIEKLAFTILRCNDCPNYLNYILVKKNSSIVGHKYDGWIAIYLLFLLSHTCCFCDLILLVIWTLLFLVVCPRKKSLSNTNNFYSLETFPIMLLENVIQVTFSLCNICLTSLLAC